MSAAYFLPLAADEADLSAWSAILPPVARVLRTNLFGDAFIVDESGSVHMLERAGCSAECVASSEEEFWQQVVDDLKGWQLRALADECRGAGKMLNEEECYAFIVPPVLGGGYTVENVWVAPRREWFSVTADLFQQIKNLPDGSHVKIEAVD